ncbi:hypothetical protein L0668_07770 [Paraglaciecola aquimarina]|uniref:Uncharacterized protein n=1 Tax=Paraglaciecola algarum TaxID=3050085 RepID=A0ABS9D6E3_9ALTE|nr:DUF6746 family protein [Paraglaciecola sp. G1-23]MCF2948000.1 hypothetical protein [Paraglaciecola sp. G1-23]
MRNQFATSLLLASISFTIFATDVDHFKGTPSPDLKSALCNLQKFDNTLKTITDKPLSANDMVQIHQLTYTLEVALQKVQQELKVAAEELEKVHKGSEVVSKEQVNTAAKKYLSKTQVLTSNLNCE